MRQNTYLMYASVALILFLVLLVLFLPHSARGRSVNIGSYRIPVEVADTDALRSRGLGGRTSLPSGKGMLFTFPDAEPERGFWMLDMRFPLDIIWIDQGTVTDISTLPAPTSTVYIPEHISTFPADRVLELNAGEAQAMGIVPGAHLDGLY